MDLSLIVSIFFVIFIAACASLLVFLLPECPNGIFTFGRLNFPFGKTAQWLIYFSSLFFAVNHFSASGAGSSASSVVVLEKFKEKQKQGSVRAKQNKDQKSRNHVLKKQRGCFASPHNMRTE